MPENNVNVKVGGRQITLASKTTATEIRKSAKLDTGSVLAVYREGRYMVVNGAIELAEGDRLIYSKPFTRESPQKFKVLSSKKQRKSDRLIRVIIPVDTYTSMQDAFAKDEILTKESYAIAVCGIRSGHGDRSYSYMVRSFHLPSGNDLIERSSISVTPKAEFLEQIFSMAQEKGTAILELHTHIRSPSPSFSWSDLASGLDSGRFLKSIGLKFVMCVSGTKGFSLAEYDPEHDAMALPEKASIDTMTKSGTKMALAHKIDMHDIDNLKVGIVGIDRMGPAAIEKLTSIGMKDFVLCEESVDIKDNDALKSCDIIISGSTEKRIKSSLNDIALRYYIPLIMISDNKNQDDMTTFVVIPTQTGCLECEAMEDKQFSFMEKLVSCCTGVDNARCMSRVMSNDCPKCGPDGILGQGDPSRRWRVRLS